MRTWSRRQLTYLIRKNDDVMLYAQVTNGLEFLFRKDFSNRIVSTTTSTRRLCFSNVGLTASS